MRGGSGDATKEESLGTGLLQAEQKLTPSGFCWPQRTQITSPHPFKLRIFGNAELYPPEPVCVIKNV